MALWAGAADGLHRLCTFESREFVQMDEAPRDEEVVECDIHGAREPSTDDWVCVKGPDGEDLTHASADPEDRTLLPLSRIGERAEQKRLEKVTGASLRHLCSWAVTTTAARRTASRWRRWPPRKPPKADCLRWA